MSFFRFKQFTVGQDRCAMKVGTDGVLLGAWAKFDNPKRVLDIGTGTGLIALMLAQRYPSAHIDALELDKKATMQAMENATLSPWEQRIHIFCTALQEYRTTLKYDAVISNPPFYKHSGETFKTERYMARHTVALSHYELLKGASSLLNGGKACFIIPFSEEKKFVATALRFKLFPNRITRVKGCSESVIKRSLLEFSFQKTNVAVDELVIEKKRHHYTSEYAELTKDFYLKM